MASAHPAPLVLTPRLDSRLWGGARIAPWMGLSQAPAQLAEAWLTDDGNAVDSGGTLKEAVEAFGPALLGAKVHARHGKVFPLLAKVIDARDKLSVQVHPDDAYVRAQGLGPGAFGKTEAWHILDADRDADVFLGLSRDTSREELRARALDGSLVELLRRVPVTPGQTLFVPAGTIHAINGGTLLFEIQQKSDLTYRLFDYGRLEANGKPRTLHLDQALAVANLRAGVPQTPRATPTAPWATSLVSCPHFALERWTLASSIRTQTTGDSFELLVPISEGPVTLSWGGGARPLSRGAAVVLPATLGEYALEGSGDVLRCFVPE